MTPTQQKTFNELYGMALKELLARHPELRQDPDTLDRRAMECAAMAVCVLDPTAGAEEPHGPQT